MVQDQDILTFFSVKMDVAWYDKRYFGTADISSVPMQEKLFNGTALFIHANKHKKQDYLAVKR